MRYGCLILTKNEEHTISSVINEILQQFVKLGLKKPIIVVSDDSKDQTPTIARRLGAEVVSAGHRGLGRAYVCGIRKFVELNNSLTEGDGIDRIIVVDGDGQALLDDLILFIETMNQSGAALVTGSRFLNGDRIDYEYPCINRLGTHALAAYLTIVSGQKFTDSHGGLRLMSMDLVKRQSVWGYQTYVQESIIDASIKKFKIVEVPTRWQKREHGHSRVVHSVTRYAMWTAPFLALRMAQRLLRFK